MTEHNVDNCNSDLSFVNPRIVRCSNSTLDNKTNELVSYPQRTVTTYEFEFITKGGGYTIVDGQKYPATSDTVFVRSPGMVVQGFLPYHSYCILWENISDSSNSQMPSFPHSILFPSYHPVKTLFEKVYEAYLTDDPYAPILIKANVLQILYYIQSIGNNVQFSQLPSLSLHMHRINLLYEYIDANLERNITLAELANECQLSEGFLCRLFKQINGISLFNYINNTRIQRARRLLIETDLPVKDISVQCGYENESYFYRIFKRKMEVSPITYRKLHRQPYSI